MDALLQLNDTEVLKDKKKKLRQKLLKTFNENEYNQN